MTPPMAPAGSARKARDLKPGDHVRLDDGRWALVLELVTSEGHHLPFGNAVAPTVSAGLLVNMRDTEGGTWGADQYVWSRTPAQQLQAVEALISDLREKALAAAGSVR